MAPSSLGFYSTTVGAAVISAALLTTSIQNEENAKILSDLNASWIARYASPTSFQGTTVLHGSTLATTMFLKDAEQSDPWGELELLGANWDGRGAEPVSREALGHAILFVDSLGVLASTFEPFAHPNGNVGLEAEEDGKAAYLVVSPSNRFTYVLRVGDTVHRGKDVDPSQMRRVLELLY